MLSFILVLLVVLILIYLKYKNFPQKEGLETQEELSDSFSTFTLNNVPLQMIYWSNRLNGNATTGDIDLEKIAVDLKATSKIMNIALYGDEDGINLKYIGMLSSIPFTINNLPLKMSVWAKRLKGDSSGGTTSPQIIANEIQYCSFLLSQALNGGSVLIYNNSNKTSINDLNENKNKITTTLPPPIDDLEYEPPINDLEDIPPIDDLEYEPPIDDLEDGPPIDDLEDINDEIEIMVPPPPTTTYESSIYDLKDNSDEYITEDLEDINDEIEIMDPPPPTTTYKSSIYDLKDNSDKYIDNTEDINDEIEYDEIEYDENEYDGFRGFTGITNFFPRTQSNKQTKKAYNSTITPFKTSTLGYTSHSRPPKFRAGGRQP